MKKTFEFHRGINGVEYFSIPRFDETGLVKSCFTTRIGGVSDKPYDSLNLGFKTNDSRENVLKNYKLVCEALDISINDLVYSDQVHKDHIKIVKSEDRGKGILYESDIKEIDGFITNVKNIGLVTIYADCVPIFLLDPIQKVIGLAHGGWRGTVLKIGAKVIKEMMINFNTNPRDCLAAIGPSIGKCCFEVDLPVADQFSKNFINPNKLVFSKDNNKYKIDLWEANKMALEEIGLLSRNIIISNICSMCNKEKLFSHRRESGLTGRMAAILELI